MAGAGNANHRNVDSLSGAAQRRGLEGSVVLVIPPYLNAAG